MTGNKSRSPQALPYGYTLHGQYQIGDVLGQGGFGITYMARDVSSNRMVAVKELFPTSQVQRGPDKVTVLPTSQESKQSFEKIKASFSKETMMLVQLQDVRDVVRLYHAFLENGTSYYVMEYLDGTTLGKKLQKDGPMGWQELSGIVKPIMVTLGRLHAAGVIHRDVSPDNIFLLKNGQRKLIDFGNVRSYSQDGAMTAYVKGNFAPWEQFSSVIQQGPYTDVYSLCVTIYYSLSGKLPPKATERYTTDSLIPLRKLRPGLPEQVYKALDHGMAVKAANRTQKMDQLYYALFGEVMPGGSKPNTASYVQQGGGVSIGGGVKPQGPASGRVLRCQSGQFAGRVWNLPLEQYFTLGRNPECHVAYPPTTKGVSRVQLRLYAKKDGRVLACDECSTYGTICVSPNGKSQLQHGKWYDVTGCLLAFGGQEQYRIG